MSQRRAPSSRNDPYGRETRPVRIYDIDDGCWSGEDVPSSSRIAGGQRRVVLSRTQEVLRHRNLSLTSSITGPAPGESRSRSARQTVRTGQAPIEMTSIQQWRDFTTGSTLSSSNSSSSSESLGGDDSGVADSSNKSRNIGPYIKYLVKRFLSETTPAFLTRDDGRKRIADEEAFVPSPKITFLIDRPHNLICQICHAVRLEMAKTEADERSCAPSLFPCGHICCSGCADKWLAQNDSCPFCRMSMRYELCTHRVEPCLIARDTIHTVPETLVNGGVIEARRKADHLGTDEAIDEMKKAQKAFERLPEDEFWILSRQRHRRW
ncbi:hypothetical protein F5Y17DRAFT_456139 [Xylariaceae sp. FL0594]|nr:hypothetical protein F5Y17DRAFT_456139 [Xylariaceae sp. FL0594]